MFEKFFLHIEFTVKNVLKYFSPVIIVKYAQIQSFIIHEAIGMNNISKGQVF
jgi:hypothetical protein